MRTGKSIDSLRHSMLLFQKKSYEEPTEQINPAKLPVLMTKIFELNFHPIFYAESPSGGNKVCSRKGEGGIASRGCAEERRREARESGPLSFLSARESGGCETGAGFARGRPKQGQPWRKEEEKRRRRSGGRKAYLLPPRPTQQPTRLFVSTSEFSSVGKM